MQKGNKDLLNYKQQDAHEFWIRLMDAMDSKENCSIKSDKLFLHDVVTIVKCGHCQKNFQTKRKCSGHIIDIRGRHTISEALDAYFAEEVIETYECEECKMITKSRTKKRYFLESAPDILCLVLNRFENRVKKIDENLNLNGQLVLSVSSKNNQVNFKLVSIINHFGSNINGGHYTSIACGPNNSFFEFDDYRVNKINAIIGRNAYILMYELTTKVFSILFLESSEKMLENVFKAEG